MIICRSIKQLFSASDDYFALQVYKCTHYTHAHTPLTALCPKLSGCAGTKKVKPIWILLKQETEWQWHQLGHMQVCTSLQTDNHASTPPLSFLQARCPSCRPTNSVKALKASIISSIIITITDRRDKNTKRKQNVRNRNIHVDEVQWNIDDKLLKCVWI